MSSAESRPETASLLRSFEEPGPNYELYKSDIDYGIPLDLSQLYASGELLLDDVVRLRQHQRELEGGGLGAKILRLIRAA